MGCSQVNTGLIRQNKGKQGGSRIEISGLVVTGRSRGESTALSDGEGADVPGMDIDGTSGNIRGTGDGG